MKMKALTALCLAICLLCSAAAAAGLVDGLDQALAGYWPQTDGQEFVLSAQIQTLLPFVEDTVAQLNGVLKHLSVQASMGEKATLLNLCVDETPVATLSETQMDSGSSLTTSLLKNRTLVSGGSVLDALAGDGQEPNAFDLFQAIDQAQQRYQALTDAILPYAEQKKANYKIQDVGAAKWSRIARLTKEQSEQLAPQIAAVLSCGMDEEYTRLIESLTYAKGFIVGLYQTGENADDIAVYMKGNVTVPDVGARSLSFQWAFSQAEDGKRVDTWKFELGKGKAGGREVYATLNRQTGNNFLLKGECETTVRADGANTTFTQRYDLSGQDGAVEGQAVFGEKTTDQAAVETTYAPAVRYAAGAISGSVQVTRKQGKNTELDYTLSFDGQAAAAGGEAYQVEEEPQVHLSSLDQNDEDASPTEPSPEYLVGSAPVGVTAYQAPDTMQSVNWDSASAEQKAALLGEMGQNLAGRLLKALAKLPQEDLALLKDNLSDEDFAAFLQMVNEP